MAVFLYRICLYFRLDLHHFSQHWAPMYTPHSGKAHTTTTELQTRQGKLCKAWPEGTGSLAKKI